MNYRVILSARAQRDLDAVFSKVRGYAPATATRWYFRFIDAIKTLEAHPTRCPIAPEGSKISQEIRIFNFGRKPNVFRVLFRIGLTDVRVLRIRRAQQRFLTSKEAWEAFDSEE